MNPWLDPLIRSARDGDVVAARKLVEYLAACLERGQAPPTNLSEYFIPALRNIAAGRSADSALNIGAKSNVSRDCKIALEVWELNRGGNRLHLRDNKHGPGAYSVIGEKYNLGVDNVERIYKSMKWLIDAMAFEMTLDPDESRERPEIPKEVRDSFNVDMQFLFAQLVDTIKK